MGVRRRAGGGNHGDRRGVAAGIIASLPSPISFLESALSDVILSAEGAKDLLFGPTKGSSIWPVICTATLRQSKDNVALLAAGVDERVSIHDPRERIGAVDDGLEFSGLREAAQEIEIRRRDGGNAAEDLPAGSGRADHRPDHLAEAADDQQQPAARRERPLAALERAVADGVEDDVVPLARLSKIFFGIVDHTIGAERFDELRVGRTTNAGHDGPEILGELHGRAAHGTRRTVDQDALAGLDLGLVA